MAGERVPTNTPAVNLMRYSNQSTTNIAFHLRIFVRATDAVRAPRQSKATIALNSRIPATFRLLADEVVERGDKYCSTQVRTWPFSVGGGRQLVAPRGPGRQLREARSWPETDVND